VISTLLLFCWVTKVLRVCSHKSLGLTWDWKICNCSWWRTSYHSNLNTSNVMKESVVSRKSLHVKLKEAIQQMYKTSSIGSRTCIWFQDFLHKLSRKLVESQVIIVEPQCWLVHNRKLAKVISDAGWGCLLTSGLQVETDGLVKIGLFFPSSKTFVVVTSLMSCHSISENGIVPVGTHHDRDGNAALNIRNEAFGYCKVMAEEPRHCWWRHGTTYVGKGARSTVKAHTVPLAVGCW